MIKQEIIYNDDLEIKNKTERPIDIIDISIDNLKSLNYINDFNYDINYFKDILKNIQEMNPITFKDNVKIYDPILINFGLYGIALTENIIQEQEND